MNVPLSDCSGTRTYNHLVFKRTLNHLAKLASLAKWLSVPLRTKGCWFKSRCSHLKQFYFDFWFKTTSHFNFRYHACFKQGGPSHSSNYIE